VQDDGAVGDGLERIEAVAKCRIIGLALVKVGDHYVDEAAEFVFSAMEIDSIMGQHARELDKTPEIGGAAEIGDRVARQATKERG
jgi:hypothetical protein